MSGYGRGPPSAKPFGAHEKHVNYQSIKARLETLRLIVWLGRPDEWSNFGMDQFLMETEYMHSIGYRLVLVPVMDTALASNVARAIDDSTREDNLKSFKWTTSARH